MANLAVEAISLVKRFGDTMAVDNVSFSVPEGSVMGLLGPNGAGLIFAPLAMAAFRRRSQD